MTFLEQILPFLYERNQVRTIRTRIAVQERKDGEVEKTWEIYRLFDEGTLEKALRAEHSRREHMQRRAQTFIGSLAVLSAFTIGGVNLFRATDHALPLWLLGSSLVLVTGYLAGGAWYALAIVSPGRLYDLNLENQLGEHGPIPGDIRVDLIINLTKLTQAQNLILTTLSERAYRFMRNAVISLIVTLAFHFADAITLHAKRNTDTPNSAMHLISPPLALRPGK